MRQPLLTNQHSWPLPSCLPSKGNDLISRLLRDPMVISPEIEDQLRDGLACRGGAPDVVGPLVCCYSAHFVRGHVSDITKHIKIGLSYETNYKKKQGKRTEPVGRQWDSSEMQMLRLVHGPVVSSSQTGLKIAKPCGAGGK